MGGERGVASLMVVVLLLPLLVAVGLCYDGGEVLAARVRAQAEAGAAARSGAQALALGVRDGALQLDPGAAEEAAAQYLAESGTQGRVSVSGTTVTVVVTGERPLVLLGLVGLGPATIDETVSAQAVAGIRGAGQ
jgi:Flp pilus assembly protein TadG